MSTKRVVLADLGWCVGRLSVDEDGVAEALIIFSSAETSPDRYAPAESITIVGRRNILALKDWLEANLKATERIQDNPETTEKTGTEAANATAES
jgi:hypothetical protein